MIESEQQLSKDQFDLKFITESDPPTYYYKRKGSVKKDKLSN